MTQSHSRSVCFYSTTAAVETKVATTKAKLESCEVTAESIVDAVCAGNCMMRGQVGTGKNQEVKHCVVWTPAEKKQAIHLSLAL